MHTPFVFRAAVYGDSIDDDFPLPKGQVPSVEQTAARKAFEQSLISSQRREQTNGHDPVP